MSKKNDTYAFAAWFWAGAFSTALAATHQPPLWVYVVSGVCVAVGQIVHSTLRNR